MDPVEDKLHVEIAKKCAMEYCKKNGLQLDKLSKQSVHNISGTVIFAQYTKKANGQGLRVDGETMPKPTLIVERTSRGYTVTPTEYTLTYLK